MINLKRMVTEKLQYYNRTGNQKKIDIYKLRMWAVVGMLDENFKIESIMEIYGRYERLGLVPTHYDYPEFYRL